jgi:hypothetical protein
MTRNKELPEDKQLPMPPCIPPKAKEYKYIIVYKWLNGEGEEGYGNCDLIGEAKITSAIHLKDIAISIGARLNFKEVIVINWKEV